MDFVILKCRKNLYIQPTILKNGFNPFLQDVVSLLTSLYFLGMMTIQLHPQLLIQFWLGAIVTMVTFWHIYTNLFPCDMKMNYYIICVNHLSNMDLYKKIYYLLNENTQWNINSVCCKSSDDLSFKVPDSLINEYFLSEKISW